MSAEPDRPMDISGYVTDVFTDWRLVAEARDEAATVAVWAHTERERLRPSLWTWARRRFLERVFRDKLAEADRLKVALEQAERRKAWEPPEPPPRAA